MFSPAALLAALRVLPDCPRLVVAYSGGLDSHVLLHAAAALRGRLDLPLAAIHLDHGLHPDAPAWAAHCRAVCAGLGLDLVERRLHLAPRPGDSLEAVAREARYQAFADLLGPGEGLLTAQHRDDQAETLLLALLRGSGVHGLAGMPARAPLGRGWLLRPLLGFDRAALCAYAEASGLRWVEDPSNADPGLDRNLLRHQVLPLLRARWPAVAASISRSAGHCAEAAALIDGAADALLPGLAGSRPGTLSVTALRGLDPPRCRGVLRRWLALAGRRPPPRARLAQIIDRVLPARPGADPLVAWDGAEVRRYRDDLFALAPLPPRPALVLDWDGAGPLALPAGLGELRILTAAMDGAGPLPADLGLRVGFGGTGHRCAGGAGHPGRGLKGVFQQAGVPPWLRPYCPLVFRGDVLLAVAGVCGCGEGRLAIDWCGHPWSGLGVFAPPR